MRATFLLGAFALTGSAYLAYHLFATTNTLLARIPAF